MQPGSRIFILALLFSVLAMPLLAQDDIPKENSPYSSHGLGDLEGTDLAASKAMGGLSAGFRSPYFLNPTNPASYSSILLTTFEAGVDFRTLNLSKGDTSFQTGSGFIDYLALAFPLNNNRTVISVGILPFSKVSYASQVTDTDDDVPSVTNSFNGEGRLYKLYAGAAHKFSFGKAIVVLDTTAIDEIDPESSEEEQKDTVLVIKNNHISLGFNAAYFFGQLQQSTIVSLPDSILAFDARNTSTTRFSDVVWDFGVQYERKLNGSSDITLTSGIWTHLPFKVNSQQSELWERNLGTLTDTILSITGAKKKVTLPAQFGLGFTISNGFQWLAGVDFSYMKWSSMDPITVTQTGGLRDSWRVAFGGEVTPVNIDKKDDDGNRKISRKSSFFTRMHYRLGAYYDRGYITINNQEVTEYGITFGLGIPIMPSRYDVSFSKLNFTMEIGKRETGSEQILGETFIKATIGFTLNNKWFTKRKYN